MAEIRLNLGKTAIVDDADLARVAQHRWNVIRPNPKRWSHSWYAACNIKGKITLLHRFIMDAPSGTHVDHLNHDGLDNRRENLRVVMPKENVRRSRLSKRNKTGFKGVSPAWRPDKWNALIRIDRKLLYLGAFNSKIEAAKAYDEAAIKHFGASAMTNAALGLL